MTCRCKERRKAITRAARGETSALTAVKFIVKTGTQDIAVVTRKGTQRVMDRLQRRGLR